MWVFLSLLGEPEGRSIDPTTAWTLIGALGGVVTAMAAYIVKMHKVYGRKINELYDQRIADLKSNLELVQTLERVVYREHPKTKGGK